MNRVVKNHPIVYSITPYIYSLINEKNNQFKDNGPGRKFLSHINLGNKFIKSVFQFMKYIQKKLLVVF